MTSPSTAKLEHLRLRDLFLIERVQELGSLRQVAEAMHLTQPAVTQALQTLEEAFGTQLVERSSGGAVLTATGLAVLQRLKAMRWEAEAAHALALEPQHPAITLGINQFTGRALVPAALAGFLQSHGHVRLDLRERSSPALWQLLTHGKLDAIVCRMPAAPAFERAAALLTYDVLGTESLLLVAAQNHPFVTQGFSKAQLAGQGWVLPPADSTARHTLDEWFLRADVPPPVATVTSESFHTNLRLVAGTALLTVVPSSTLAELGGALRLAAVPTGMDWDGITTFFACRTSSLGNPLVQALRAQFVHAGRLIAG